VLKQLDIDGSIHLDWRDLEDAMIALYIYLQTPTLNAPAFDIAKFSYVHTYRTNACKLAYTKLLFVRCVSTHNFIADKSRSGQKIRHLGILGLLGLLGFGIPGAGAIGAFGALGLWNHQNKTYAVLSKLGLLGIVGLIVLVKHALKS